MKSISYVEFIELIQPALNYREEREVMSDAFMTLVGDHRLQAFHGADVLLDSYLAVLGRLLDVDPEALAKIAFEGLSPAEAYEHLASE